MLAMEREKDRYRMKSLHNLNETSTLNYRTIKLFSEQKMDNDIQEKIVNYCSRPLEPAECLPAFLRQIFNFLPLIYD